MYLKILKMLSSYLLRLYKFVCLGLVVVISFTLIWAPFLHSMDASLAVLQRLFPFNRGLYEVTGIFCFDCDDLLDV